VKLGVKWIGSLWEQTPPDFIPGRTLVIDRDEKNAYVLSHTS
jgi:hypothetical protein